MIKKVINKNHKITKTVDIQTERLDNAEYFKWGIRSDKFDWIDTYWGFPPQKYKKFFKEIKKRLDDYASMRWSAVEQMKSCHSMDFQNLSTDFQKRIITVCGKNNPPETLYQITMNAKHRLWGERASDNRFYLMFDDSEHQGYPVSKKHT